MNWPDAIVTAASIIAVAAIVITYMLLEDR